MFVFVSEPSKAPQNVQGIDYTGPFSVFVKWSPVPTGFVHGVLLGYRVLYRKISEADLEVQDNLMIKTLPPNQLQTYLEDLTTYSTYQIQVLAFTSKGDGPPSNPVLISK